jgi:excisionase family DNA binding protein
MATGKRGVAASGNNLEPLAVSPRHACLLLGVGNTRLYQLIGNGELIAYKEGRARRITISSIRARVARLADGSEAPQPRRRGRPRKHCTVMP